MCEPTTLSAIGSALGTSGAGAAATGAAAVQAAGAVAAIGTGIYSADQQRKAASKPLPAQLPAPGPSADPYRSPELNADGALTPGVSRRKLRVDLASAPPKSAGLQVRLSPPGKV